MHGNTWFLTHLASSFVEYFSRGRMNSWSGTQKTLTKSNKFLYRQRMCGCLTSSSMSCKSCCCWHHYYCCHSAACLCPEEKSLLRLSPTCSVDVGKSPDIPYVYVTHDGLVRNYKPIQVVTACTLNIYNFPFDVQKCSLTFQSWLHTSKTLFTCFTHIHSLFLKNQLNKYILHRNIIKNGHCCVFGVIYIF